ncbi:fat-like cadherin-related tumor suppressor homolog isoform X2 [Ornithodoros turicata]|uniref:fat-like cadherin-related tumor suppressor homolog isoform X2 n=1 Tax=Ornithodoros turicata TaxID=34597 RepID=UPI00313962AC
MLAPWLPALWLLLLLSIAAGDTSNTDRVAFTRATYNASIPENSVRKRYVQPTEKMGIFISDPTLHVRYKIAGGDKDRQFKAEARHVGDFWFLFIRTRTENAGSLNREYEDHYRLKVKGSIFYAQQHKRLYDVHCEVVVEVTDTNDLNPLFYPKSYNVTVPEDTPLHQSVLKLSAYDPDLGVNGEIYYRVLERTRQFAIHPTMGTITLTRPLDYQRNETHEFTVVAEDRGPKLRTGSIIKSSTATVTVRVLPVNKHKPVIFVRNKQTWLEPGLPDVWAVVKVTDKDPGIHGQIAGLAVVDGDIDDHFKIVPLSQPGEFNIEVDPRPGRPLNPKGYTLTLRAWDQGTPSQYTDEVVRARLSDVDNLLPTFSQPEYDVDIEEVAPPNTPVAKVEAHVFGQEKAKITYHIETGDDDAAFNINTRTGLITLRRVLDREVKMYYSLTVSASNAAARGGGQRKRTTTIVNIKVLDCNDNPPVFNESSAEVIYDENKPVGSKVYTAHAVDADEAENGYVSYSLVNLNHVPFSVDPFSGEVRTTEVLDFETMRRNYVLRIRATDWGIPYQRQTEMTLRVRVKDVNDHRPQFEKVDCVATVSKKAEIGTEILTLSAIDFDEGGTGTVSYKMEPSGEDSCFRLDPSTGVLTLACDLSQQQGKERSLNVTATDGRHFADVMKVLVRIVGARRPSLAECKDMGVAQRLREQLRAAERSNPRGAQEDRVEPTAPSFLENRHGPEFSEGAPSEISVDEDLSVNSVLVRLEAKDLDHGYNGKVLYVISDGDEDSCLRMDMHTGDLVLTAPLDREVTPMYILNITAYDQGHPPKAESRTLVVKVRDVNDNAPVFEKSSYSFILNENVANGTSLSRLRATDKDEGLNAEFRFVLYTDTSDFALNPTSGLLTVAGPLDRERQEKYSLVVKLIDGDPVTPLTSTATVSVRLQDVNDNAPSFTLRQYMARVREDLPLGSIVTSMSAKDPDWGNGGKVHYEIIGKYGDIFDVDPDMGIVRLISALDFETCRIYNVTVAATDSGDPELSSAASLLVEVEDVNENLHTPVFPDMVANASVDENQPKGTLVTSISAVDEDTSGNDGKVTYAIVDGDGMGVFTIDDKGDLRTSAVLDCEAKSHYWITVVAQDRAAVPLMSRLEMYIEVNDVNDNVPLTRESAYNPSVAENSLEGTVVVQLDAFDLDNSPGQKLSFAISAGDPHRHFQIDPESGLITTTSIPLDREMQNRHVLEVTVSDAGDPPLSSTTQVIVTVTDVNDHQPRFLQTSNRFRVLEQDDQEEPVELCQVLASDRDHGAYGEIEYSIMQGAGQKFRINPATGAIYSRFALVNGDSHELLVKAFDQGDPSLYSTTKVQLHVVARPVSSAHSPKIKEVEVSPTIEDDKVGHMVAVVRAVDLDGDSLWYTITGGNQENKFMIRKEEGLIQLARPLDWETTPVYNLTVEATDGIGKASTMVTVNIVDTNDNWPEFSESTFRAEISESIPSGTDIVQLTGADADKDKRLFYSIFNSASPLTLQKFTVDSLTGVLSTRQTLDHEEARRHMLTVMVKDMGAPVNKRNFARVIINVSDHNDHPPEFLSSMFEGKVYETVAIGTSVVDVRAVDRDRGRNAQMTFSIVSGNVGGTFNIHPQLGTLTVAKELSQQTLPEYFLTVRATDHGEPPLNATVTVHIIVTIADNASPRFDPPNRAIEIYENEKPGTFILSLTVVSRSSLYFEITSGNKGNSFSVDPSSGILSTNRALDYEWTRFYNLTVTATNLVGVNASTLVLVHVLDRNDNAPRFLQSRYDGVVSEAAEPGSVVLTEGNAPLVVTAEDEDSELNALLTFEIVEVWARKQFKVDPNTGALSIVTKLDREAVSSYSFTVQVSDTGRPKLAARNPVPIHINVTDVNDTPPHFDHQYYNATLLLPTYQGVQIAKVRATDPDLESPLGIKYTLVTGDHEGHFEVLQDTGDVLVRNPENLRDLYRLVISANDGQFETATFVIVTVGRSGEGGLRFASDSYEAHISENSTMVSVVTIVTVLGSALNEHISFHILNPSDKFKIGRTSGVIRTTGVAFDRELVGSYRLVVEARSDATDPPRVAHVLVEVGILDENDNAPIFVNLPYYSVVPVEAKAGDLVRKVEAIDLDLGENGHIRYELRDGHNEMFHINPSTGDITLKQPLGNHNTDYTLVVIAKDNGIPSLQSEAVVPIKVVNRAMPVFPQQFYTVSVPENQQPHVPVLTVQADSPKGRQLIYSIVFGNSNEEFAVDFNTGVLYVVEHLDYETTQKYQLTLRATDSVNGAFADVLVSISVEDVNDFPPMFTQPSYNTSVSEAAPFATSILKVYATDRDTGPNAQIQYSLQGKAQATFHIDPSEGTLFIKASLDHETQPMYHLVVMATDNGSPAALSSTAHVWVTVMDMNDNPPAFQHPTYHCAIGELASRGQFVTRVAASDPDSSDKDKLVYSIVGGNEVQAFTINRKTGIITLSNLHQFPQQAAYVLNVSTTDGVYLSHAKVIVTVLPSNEHPPVFTHTIYEAALPENESPGHLVITVVATDMDRSNFGRVTYSITSDDCARDFRIDPTTGDVFTTKSLDREVRHLYEIPVSARDGGGRIAFTVVRVAVTDVNDNEPQFAVSEYRANIPANITVGTTILKVRAFDKDQGLGGSLQYGIHESNGLTNITSLFDITRDSGEIYVKALLSGKENNAYQFFVKVSDHGKPKALENVAPVTVVVMHPNEVAPQMRLTNFDYFLRESDPIGTVVLTLNASQTHLRKGHDFKHHLTYSFVAAPNGSGHELDSSLFSLDEQGRMILAGTLDRETKSTYYVTVCVETELSLVSFVDLTVHVMDDNDNAPSFDTAGYTTSVAENIEEGCTVAKITAHDPDAGESRKITYEFYEGNDPAADIFQVDSHTGWITTLVPLDREAVPFYNFTVMARDDGLPPMYSTTWVYVEVLDVNDNAPVFQRPRYDAAIYEDAMAGTVIVTLETKDADVESGPVDFYIVSGDPGEHFGMRKTGEVYVNRALDRESTASYFLEVVATDGVFVAKTQVAIDVLDSNDNPPICLKSKYTELVSESIAVNTYILRIEATDADENRNAQMRYHLSGKGSDDFVVNASTGVLKTSKALDREQQSRYLLTAHVQDWSQWEWECTSTVEILLSDVNDNPPTFTEEAYSVSVAEDVDVGTLVTKVHATDKDLGMNRRVSYSFVDSARGHFGIDESSGIVRLNKPLDREERALYNLTVQARDHGTPELSSLATLIVAIQDVNDNPPEFSRKVYHATVSEAASIGYEVLRVHATSRDSGMNAEITYFLSGGNERGHFTIDAKTGSIEIANPLDYEVVKDYFLTVLARDGGVPALSNQATVNISVTDYNDNPPVFGQQVYNAIVREDAIIGDRIIQVIARDADSPANAIVSYAILQGDRHNQFHIEKETGYISLAAPLDREAISNYVLEVECTDSGTPPLASRIFVNIEASDVNDNVPTFSKANYSEVVQEGKPVGFTVAKFTVTDADAAPNAAPFTLDIVSGNDNNAFRVVQQDATLRTAAKLDPKIRTEYNLRVRVTDSGTPPLSSEIWVHVKVVEESQFHPQVSPLSISVSSYLDDFPGGVLGRIHASDKDPYDKLTYELVSLHQHLFSVDREDGTLVALPGLDVGKYTVNVSVSDGKFTTHAAVSVEVDLVSEEGLANAVGIRLDSVTPEDFLVTYKKGFLRGLRSLLNVRLKDVQIISIQPAADVKTNEIARSRRSTRQDLDVLFALRKGSHGYYSAKLITNKLRDNVQAMETAVGLKVVQVTEDRCTSTYCVHGECFDHVVLDRTYAVSLTTDTLSFVSPQHYRQIDCQCTPGFGGPKCEMAVNECSRKPCPPQRICVPDSSTLGYSCQCPDGKTGPSCNIIVTCQDPDCYEEKHPVSFGGKSYAHYTLTNPMDRRITLALRLRTIQSTGNLMYSAGARDYSILEVVNGCVQYRFDCGSGEGVVRVGQKRVSDGSWHEVMLERRGNFARLSIDHRYESSGAAPGVHDILNLDGNDMFFGAEVRVAGYDDLRMGFVGCLDDVRVDGILLPLHVSGGSTIATLRRFANVQFSCKTLFDPGVCGSQPCQNGGSCLPSTDQKGDGYTCTCLSRFKGNSCQIDTNPCASAPCLNGGTCQNDPHGGYKCNCPQRLSGKRCDYGRYCNPNPCQNDGVCEEGTRSHVCRCRGFQGSECQHDVDECVHVPCAIGATCLNLPGSFQCVCPANATGPLCSNRYTATSVFTSALPSPLLEIVWVAVGLLVLFLLAACVACCWKKRRKQRLPNDGRNFHGAHPLDQGVGNEMTLKNCMLGTKDNVKRMSKVSNLDHQQHQTAFTTPPLPPRPASYTPSMQQDTALNNFDTVRSYGSAADDLESRYTANDLKANLAKVAAQAGHKQPLLQSNSASDTTSLQKAVWDPDKGKIYVDKIPNDLKAAKAMLPAMALNKNLATPTRKGPATYAAGLASDDLPASNNNAVTTPREGYTWDYSDLTTEQKPLANITEVPGNEVQDSSSLHSADSNSQNSQIDLLPSNKGSEAAESEYVGDSETNESVGEPAAFQGYDQLLQISEDDEDGPPSSLPHRYDCHPNQYLPSHCLSSGTSPADDESEDGVVSYGFPSQGGRGFLVSDAVSLATTDIALSSNHPSCSDLSMNNVCDIEDSDEDDDTDSTVVRKPLTTTVV